ncbi:MAG: alginate export family protein [Spirochaetota bacterium]|nr:alginate export family protein [Spirochaetota bacterium]
MKRIIILLFIVLFAFFLNTDLFSEEKEVLKGDVKEDVEENITESESDDFYPDFKSDEDMKILISERKPFSISYGGWLYPSILDERKGSSELLSTIIITKLWLKSWLWKRTYIYIRFKDVYMNILENKERPVDNDSDNLFDLDVAFASIQNEKNTLKLFLGRKFFSIGTGLVFNGRGDGGEFNFNSRYVDVKLLGAYTGLLKKDNNPYNLSSKDISDGAKRLFVGGTISKGYWNQILYLLGLMQIDKGDEESGEKSRYNSNYYGIGLKGVLGDTYYFAEYIYETGESYIDGTDEKEDVKANAAIVGLNYYLNRSYNPVLLLQYAYGSGDKDRDNYKSPTGNRSGSDNGFLYFGSFEGGYGLKPILANIHIVRIGLSFTPLYDSTSISLRRMNLIAKYSYYFKDESESEINFGVDASKSNRDIGHGLDVAFRWKIFSDFSFHINYALFLPGNAYPSSEDMTHFIMSGFLFSF